MWGVEVKRGESSGLMCNVNIRENLITKYFPPFASIPPFSLPLFFFLSSFTIEKFETGPGTGHGWPWAYCVAKNDSKLLIMHQGLGLQTSETMLQFCRAIFKKGGWGCEVAHHGKSPASEPYCRVQSPEPRGRSNGSLRVVL